MPYERGNAMRKFLISMIAILSIVGTACAGETGAQPQEAPQQGTSEGGELPPAEGTEESPEEPASEPAGEVGSSLDAPVQVGTKIQIGTWEVEVTGFTENATEAVHSENSYNDKPKNGQQYVLVTLRTTYAGSGSSDPWSDQTWSVITPDGTLFEEASSVLPKDLSNAGNVPAGVSAVGNVAFIVPSADAGELTLYIEAYTDDFDTEGAFFALK